MRRYFGKRIVSLFVASFFMLISLAGCSGGERFKGNIAETELSRDIATESVFDDASSDASNDEIGSEIGEEIETEEQNELETESDKFGENLTGDSKENKDSEAQSQSNNKTTELETTSKSNNKATESETTSKSNDKATESETTSKSNDKASEKNTTENITTQSTIKQTSKPAGDQTTKQTNKQTTKPTTKPANTTTQKTTTKPANTTTQKTTAKPNPVEQTTTAAKVSKAEHMAKEIVDDIITSKMTEFEKALIIHDWLTFNLDYDFTYSNFYVEETLTDRRCVCQGYALTFKMMCEMAGLDVIYVTGTGKNSYGQTESHAWNQVKIDGKWYNVDVTWDDPASYDKDFNDHSGNRHNYFLISDDTLNKDHVAMSSGRQTCSSDYDRVAILKAATNNEYHKDFEFATNAEEFAAAINKSVESNKSKIIIQYYDENLTIDTMWDTLYEMTEKAKYPVSVEPSYPPENGITTYVLSFTKLSDWNKMPVATDANSLTKLIDDAFERGESALTVRYEPTDGKTYVVTGKYQFWYSYADYNDGKCRLIIVEKDKP